LNEFLEWMRKNAMALAAGAAGLLVLSAVIGFVIGRSQRGSATRNGEAKEVQPNGVRFETSNSSMLPAPIVPDIDEGSPSFSFILDGADAFLADMELLPLRYSDLLANRAADVQPHVKPFVLNNEEFDVLMEANELAEP
jgi:hypothetical protein